MYIIIESRFDKWNFVRGASLSSEEKNINRNSFSRSGGANTVSTSDFTSETGRERQ